MMLMPMHTRAHIHTHTCAHTCSRMNMHAYTHTHTFGELKTLTWNNYCSISTTLCPSIILCNAWIHTSIFAIWIVDWILNNQCIISKDSNIWFCLQSDRNTIFVPGYVWIRMSHSVTVKSNWTTFRCNKILWWVTNEWCLLISWINVKKL